MNTLADARRPAPRPPLFQTVLTILVILAAGAVVLWDWRLARALFLPQNFLWTLHGAGLGLLVLLVVDLGVRFAGGRRLDLTAETPQDAAGRVLRVRRALVLGSNPGGRGVVLSGPQVSRRHLEVARGGAGRLIARDLGSTNGTFRRGEDLRAHPAGLDLEAGDELELGHGGPVVRCIATPGRSALSDRGRLLAWLGLLWSGFFLGWRANLEKLPPDGISVGQVTVDFTAFLHLAPWLCAGLLASVAGLLHFRPGPGGRRGSEAGAAVLVLLVLGLVLLYSLLPAVALRYARAAERAFASVEETAGPGAWRKLELREEEGGEDQGYEEEALSRASRRYEQGRGALRWATNLAARDGQPLWTSTYFRQAIVLILAVLVGLGAPPRFPAVREGARRLVEALQRPVSEDLVRAADHGSAIARLLRPVAYWDVACGFLAAAVVAVTLWSPFGTSLGRGKSLYLDLPGIPTVQSVELTKALFVLFVTGYFARQGALLARVARRRYLLPYALAALATLALTGVQADLGGLFMLGLFLGLVFVAATGHLRMVLWVPLLLLPGLALAALLGLFSVVSTRLGIWLDTRAHALGEQLVEARQLLLSSGWTGFPPHRQLASRIPDIQGDLVFAACGERFGLVGLLALVGCWFLLVASLLREARQATRGAGILLASVAALVLVQVLTQTGGTTGLLPLTGVPIPWMSHGLTASLIFTGLVTLALAAGRHEGETAAAPDPTRADPLRYLDWANRACAAVLAVFAALWTVLLPAHEDIGLRGRLYRWQDASHPNRYAARPTPRGALTTSDGAVAARTDDHGRRLYPFAEAFFHPVGYGGPLGAPSGVEAAARRYLRGLELDRTRRLERFKADVHHGPDMILTLDSDLQRTAFEELAERPGAAVVLDLRDGALLVLASVPGVNANTAGLDAWRDLADDPGQPLRPRAIRSTDVYSPPGSVFKIVIAAAILESGEVSPRETTWCDGRDEELRVACAHGSAHGEVDLRRALVVSCNVYFARRTVRLGADAVRRTAERFGFNDPEPPNLLRGVPSAQLRPGVSTVGATPDLNERDLARIGYGQGPVSATPLQVARMAAVVASSGDLIDPFLARSLELNRRQDAEGAEAKRGAEGAEAKWGAEGAEAKWGAEGAETIWRLPVEGSRRAPAIPASVAEALRGPLTEVFEGRGGTARRLEKLWWSAGRGWILAAKQPRDENGEPWRRVRVAGKTGSAWKTRRDRTDDAWMVAWAPSEDPRVVVSVLVEDAGEGGKVAGPIAMRLLRGALENLGHQP